MSAPVRASHAAFATPDLASAPVPSTTATAASAQSASRVLIPGTWRTFENREVLRGMGLRWDPPTHAWHGDLSLQERTVLRERFGLAIRPVVALEAFPSTSEGVTQAGSPLQPPRGPSPSLSSPSAPTPSFRPTVRDGSRTRAEARIMLKPGVPDPEDRESRFDSDAGRTFSWWEVTSGLPDDSREADECQEARRLADLRGRVKAARALVSTTPGLAEILQRAPRRRALFFARNGITETQFRHGVPGLVGLVEGEDPLPAPAVDPSVTPFPRIR